MSCEYDGSLLRFYAGDGLCDDDPRGRELAVNVELGVPTTEFDSPKYLYHLPTKVWGGHDGPRIGHGLNPDYRQYGSWGFGIHVWRWAFRISVRGPILGHYPPPEQDTLLLDEKGSKK